MAALLYSGEYVHARHQWRRWRESNPPSYLKEWWAVGSAMMALFYGSNEAKSVTDLASTIWKGLEHIQSTHPAPLSNYAKEVGTAYRRRIIESCKIQPPPQPYWTLLNFATTADFEQFFRERMVNAGNESTSARPTSTTLAMDAKTSLTQVVAFLESKPPVGLSIGPGRS